MASVSLGPTLRAEYETLFNRCIIRPARAAEVDAWVASLIRHRARYAKVQAATGVPWHVIAVIHNMESSQRFNGHLHNGDPLSARTRHTPRGRPRQGKPPFTWEQSATDALALKKLNARTDWSLAGTLYQLERYNGFGYRLHHPHVLSPYPLFKQHGLKLRNRIVWTFGHGLHCQKRFSGRHETILWFTKGDDYTFNLDPVRIPSKYPEKKHFKGPNRGQLSSNPLGKNPSDVWDIPNVKANHVEKTDHPCQFPVGLVERLVLSLTNVGENVLDPYLGVGSSAIAALKNDRNAYGCDITKDYVVIARQRVEQLIDGTLRTRPMNKPVYEPPVRVE